MLRVKRLEAGARMPVVAHPGEDLGYDLFALETTVLAPRATVKVRTGIAVEARDPVTGAPLGLLVRDRSSMAARGIATTGGVIDAGLPGRDSGADDESGRGGSRAEGGGEDCANDSDTRAYGEVEEVESLEESARAEKGFGSSGS